MTPSRVLLIGWDAADWKVIQPLLVAGQMPNLARLMGQGVHGNLATIYPVLSPMLWTSIATGKRPYKHGVHGFSEPLADGSGVRPISILSRKTKAVWNILNQTGRRSLVVGWWPSHPAEPINGVMVSNHFPFATGFAGTAPPPPLGVVNPASLSSTLSELRVNPMELTGEFLRWFVPEYERVDQENDKRLHSLVQILAETMSVHAVATELLTSQPWDFAAIYYCGIDHFGHAFMRYHPPRLAEVSESDFALYQGVVANAYRYHDAMLGTLLASADEDTTVILMSDHGFHADHLRAGYIPAEPAGPAVEHRHFGILCLKGPGLRRNERVLGASILDVCPTVLALFGLPPGKDMDGKVLTTVFQEAPQVVPIDSWDEVPGEAGLHPADARLDAVSSAEAFKQLVELGYVAPPAADVAVAVAEAARELKYNLARALRDGNRCADAVALGQELWDQWPGEHRFGLLLVEALAALRDVPRRRSVIDELAERVERYRLAATAELEARAKSAATEETSKDDPAVGRRRYEERLLREQAAGRPLLIEWLRLSQALLENNPAEAREWMARLGPSEELGELLVQPMAAALAHLGNGEAARDLLEKALRADPENALLWSQLAGLHFRAKRFDLAIEAATDSLCLIYFQPALHALLGCALLETRRVADAEKELLVAVAQSPRNLAAHEALGRLYRDSLARPADAFAHEGRAMALRHELAAAGRARAAKSPGSPAEPAARRASPFESSAVPAHFASTVEFERIITVVSGLPRSGTSMMMQLLAAAGRVPLTDSLRPPDEDNPLGYLEFAPALNLAKDVSWVPSARGKVVKIVAQLLPLLPSGEYYQVILMERDLEEVIASQRAMLARQGRSGAQLDQRQLGDSYLAQLERVRRQLARRPDMRLCVVKYAELLAAPRAGIERLAGFLGARLDVDAAVSAVRPELRRQAAHRTSG